MKNLLVVENYLQKLGYAKNTVSSSFDKEKEMAYNSFVAHEFSYPAAKITVLADPAKNTQICALIQKRDAEGKIVAEKVVSAMTALANIAKQDPDAAFDIFYMFDFMEYEKQAANAN